MSKAKASETSFEARSASPKNNLNQRAVSKDLSMQFADDGSFHSSWHSMEWLHHQQGCIWQHESPKYSQHHSRSPSLHLRSHHPDRTPAHITLKLAVNTRSGDTRHHGWNRPAGRPRTTWMSEIVRDSGLSAGGHYDTAGYAQQWVSECVR